MNGRQKVVLIAGWVLFLVAGLYPPWTQSWSFVAGGEDIQFRIAPGSEGYSWIFRAPGVPNWVDGSFPKPDDPNVKEDAIKDITENGMRVVLRSVRSPGPWRSRIDVSRLWAEWALILVSAGVGFLCFAPKCMSPR
ncbi:MAG TPA: hypothetical protein VMO17_02910 [Terriglobia bacterium]|nr:hypothetical protein [Terriglobia bacterium]